MTISCHALKLKLGLGSRTKFEYKSRELYRKTSVNCRLTATDDREKKV